MFTAFQRLKRESSCQWYIADKISGATALIFFLGGISAVNFIFSLMTPPLILGIFLFLLLYTFYGLGNGAVFQLVPHRWPHQTGLMTGIIGAAGGIGGFYLPTVNGIVFETTGSYNLAFALFGVIGLLGCGLYINEKGKIKGNPEHPANKGDICKKPIYLPDTFEKGRILKPYVRIKDELKEIEWNEAYDIIADKLRKFVKGFLKTNNIDSNSRLCMASAVTAYKLAFGSDGVPCCYEDIDDADAFLFIGSNAAISHPVLFKRVLNRKRKEEKAEKVISLSR